MVRKCAGADGAFVNHQDEEIKQPLLALVAQCLAHLLQRLLR